MEMEVSSVMFSFFYHVQLNENKWQYAEIEVTIDSEQVRVMEEDEGMGPFIEFVGECLAHELEIPIESVRPVNSEEFDKIIEMPTEELLHRSYTVDFFETDKRSEQPMIKEIPVCFKIQPVIPVGLEPTEAIEDYVYMKAIIEVEDDLPNEAVESIKHEIKKMIALDVDLPVEWFSIVSLEEYEANSLDEKEWGNTNIHGFSGNNSGPLH